MRLQAAIVLLLLLRAQADTCSSALQKYNCSTSTSPSACRACAAANPTVTAACPNKIELYFLCAGARPTPSPPPAPGPPTGRRPANPSNLTVYGLRPYEIPGLSNKDTADAEGDVYFWMTDKILTPLTCREDPRWPLCESSQEIADNQVYEQTVLEIDTQTGKYALCNPLTSDPTGKTWDCQPNEAEFGAGGIIDVGVGCRGTSSCDKYQFLKWRLAAAQTLGGNWYSSQPYGDCDNALTANSSCYWRVVETLKIKNASCVNDKVTSLIEEAGEPCFHGCASAAGGGKKNVTSDCYITCFFNTFLGNGTTAGPGVAKTLIMNTFNTAFASEEVDKGGCPLLPPYTPPAQL